MKFKRAFALAFAAVAASSALADYSYLNLQPVLPGHDLFGPLAINNKGHLLFQTFDLNSGNRDGILVIDDSGPHRVAFPDGNAIEIFPSALSSDDTIGGYYSLPNGVTNLFELTDEGRLKIMPPPPSNVINSIPNVATFAGMNDHGDFTLGPPFPLFTTTPYYFAKGHYIPIQYPGNTDFTDSGISGNGTVAGSLLDIEEGFLLKNGKFTLVSFPDPQTQFTGINCISNNGQFFAGEWGKGKGDHHGFVRDKFGTFTSLDYPWPPTKRAWDGSTENLQPFERSLEISGINDSGVICGTGHAFYSGTTGNGDFIGEGVNVSFIAYPPGLPH